MSSFDLILNRVLVNLNLDELLFLEYFFNVENNRPHIIIYGVQNHRNDKTQFL